MRRQTRNNYSDNGFKRLMYISGGVLVVAIIAFIITLVIYNNRVKSQTRVSLLNSNKIAELVPSISTENEDLSQASNPIGKTVNEVQNSLVNNNTIQNNTVNNTTNTENSIEKNNEVTNTNASNTNVKATNTSKPEEKKELKFGMPVEGEISKEFAKDNLIYSETLKEWITHLGIDIKAEKTSVVKASEDGTVKSIKNDPRYGLTVIMEHEDGFKTIYSNLLTAEFVSEGEEISKGQTIGTVGSTAVFEASDEPHLHFEILKKGEYVDPNIYLK